MMELEDVVQDTIVNILELLDKLSVNRRFENNRSFVRSLIKLNKLQINETIVCYG